MAYTLWTDAKKEVIMTHQKENKPLKLPELLLFASADMFGGGG